MDRPTVYSSGKRFELVTGLWELLSPMAHGRGSFACAAVPGQRRLLVVGGGSRLRKSGAAWSRISLVWRHDVEPDQRVEMESTVSVDEYYTDASVLDLRGRDDVDMWEERERMRIGKVLAGEDDEGLRRPQRVCS